MCASRELYEEIGRHSVARGCMQPLGPSTFPAPASSASGTSSSTSRIDPARRFRRLEDGSVLERQARLRRSQPRRRARARPRRRDRGCQDRDRAAAPRGALTRAPARHRRRQAIRLPALRRGRARRAHRAAPQEERPHRAPHAPLARASTRGPSRRSRRRSRSSARTRCGSAARTRSSTRATADLVVTVGGDGTLLAASHRVGTTPILGVNSAPASFGRLLLRREEGQGGRGDRASARRQLRAVELTRMAVMRNGEAVSTRVLNDALFCHRSPAATTRYIVTLGRRRGAEVERLLDRPCGGLDRGPALGGGKILPLPRTSFSSWCASLTRLRARSSS